MTVNHDVTGSSPVGGVCSNSSKRAEPSSHVKCAGRWGDMDSNHHKHKVHYFYLCAVVAVVARKAHNLEVGGSNPSCAINTVVDTY